MLGMHPDAGAPSVRELPLSLLIALIANGEQNQGSEPHRLPALHVTNLYQPQAPPQSKVPIDKRLSCATQILVACFLLNRSFT